MISRALRPGGFRIPSLVLGGVLASCGLATVYVRAANPAAPEYRTDSVLVAFKDAAPLTARLSTVSRYGLEADPKSQNPYFAVLHVGPQARAQTLGASGTKDIKQ